MLFLQLLGGVSLRDESGPLDARVAQRRRLALLALLGASPTQTLSRDKLIGYLWQECDAERARHLLADAVYKLRRVLGVDAVVSVGDDLRLNSEIIRTDVDEFERAIADADVERAVAVWRGPFLDGFFVSDAPEFERWVETERDRLGRAYGVALKTLAAEREGQGQLDGAVDAWSRLAAHDPYDSRAAIGLMRALSAAGHRGGAIQHARVHAALLRQELDAEPDPEVEALAESLRESPAPDAKSVIVSSRGGDRGQAISEIPRAGGERGPTEAGRRRARRWIVSGGVIGGLALATALAAREWRDAGRPAALPSIRSLVVLPLENLSHDDEQEYFADGMTDALITSLAHTGEFQVISRTSAMQYKHARKSVPQIARELGVDAVVEGTVLRSGNRVRITAQLIHAATDRHLWARSYERAVGDLLALQGELAHEIATEVGARTGLPRPRSAERELDAVAYELYLKGRYAWNRRTEDGLLQAVQFFNQAIARDPTAASAYAGLADCYNILAAGYARRPPRELYAMAKAAANRAVELDTTLAEAYAALGWMRGLHEWDWAGAEEAFRRAMRLNPSYATAHQWYALMIAGLGRVDEALAELRLAQQLDPLSQAIAVDVARVLYYYRRHNEAAEELRKTLALNPDFARAHGIHGAVQLAAGKPDEAIRSHQRAIELAGGWLQQRWGQPGLGYAYAVTGRRADALGVLRELERERAARYERPESLGLVSLGLSRSDEALTWLEKAAEERSIYPLQLRDPVYDAVRAHPRFVALLRRLNVD